VVREHFEARDRSENAYFSEFLKETPIPEGVVRRNVPAGGVNPVSEVAFIQELEPDVVLVFGCGLLHSLLIDRFEGRIINLHLGLSPYYRGSGTNFWPLVNREPEYVGVTIHGVDAGIDTGPIICHGRPEIERGDGIHDIGNKAIMVGTDLLISTALRRDALRSIPSVPQRRAGKLYRTGDFHAGAVRKMRHNFETGMIEDYLANKAERDRSLRLVECCGTVS